MATIIPDEGAYSVSQIFAQLDASMSIRLYKVANTNTATTVFADFTEADFDGYTAVTAPTPTYGYDTGNNRGYVDFGTQTWTCTGSSTPNTVYGVLLCCVDLVGGTPTYVILASDFPAPYTMNTNGQTFDTHPKLYFAN